MNITTNRHGRFYKIPIKFLVISPNPRFFSRFFLKFEEKEAKQLYHIYEDILKGEKLKILIRGQKMLKRFFALFVAMLMLAGLCVPIYAVDPDADTCTCEEPWPENPEEYGTPYITDKNDDVHIWAQDYIQQCSRCNLYYVEVGRTWEESHYSILLPIRLPDGSIVYFGICNEPDCGVEYYVSQ